jgi:hypothetical protein
MPSLLALFALLLFLLSNHITKGDEPDKILQDNKAKAILALNAKDYDYLITQHASNSTAPDPSGFRQYLLDEINHDSVMRDQIDDELEEIESNGHNSSILTEYYTRDQTRNSRLDFKNKDLNVSVAGKEGGDIYTYQATFTTTDGYHGGYEVIKFKFLFKVKVDVVAYPKYQGKEEIDHPDNKQ